MICQQSTCHAFCQNAAEPLSLISEARDSAGNTTDKPLLGSLMGRGKAAQAQAPQAANMMATTQEPSTLGYGSMSAEEEDLSTFGYGSSEYGSTGHGSSAAATKGTFQEFCSHLDGISHSQIHRVMG